MWLALLFSSTSVAQVYRYICVWRNVFFILLQFWRLMANLNLVINATENNQRLLDILYICRSVVKYLYISATEKKKKSRHTFETMVCTHGNGFNYITRQLQKILPATSRLRIPMHIVIKCVKRGRDNSLYFFFFNTRKACAKERGVLYGILIAFCLYSCCGGWLLFVWL